MPNVCLHPRVQIVSRDEEAEFVECLECREVFDSSEFRDMDIESKLPTGTRYFQRSRDCRGVPAGRYSPFALAAATGGGQS